MQPNVQHEGELNQPKVQLDHHHDLSRLRLLTTIYGQPDPAVPFPHPSWCGRPNCSSPAKPQHPHKHILQLPVCTQRCLVLYKKQTTNFSFSLLNKNMDYNHTFYLINITWSEVEVWYCTQTVIKKILKLLTCIWDKIWLDAVNNGFSTSLNWKSPIFHHNIYIYIVKGWIKIIWCSAFLLDYFKWHLV